jgi:O-acetylserine/cysteine efflux transporter
MQLNHLLLAILVTSIWGFNFVVVTVGMEGISPLLLCFTRLFLTSIPAVFFIKKPDIPLSKIILYGISMFSIQFSLLFSAIYAGVTPGLASILIQFQVFFTILFGLLLFKEKLKPWQIAGALISFAGIAIVGMHVGGEVTWAGIFLIIGASASWGIGNVVSKHIGKVNIVSLVIWGSLISWPPLLLFSIWFEGLDNMLETAQYLTWTSIGAALYITYVSTLFGFCVWSWLLAHYPLATIAPFTLLIPIFGILSAALILDEALQPWKISAGVLVIAGLCVNMLGPKLQLRLAKAA